MSDQLHAPAVLSPGQPPTEWEAHSVGGCVGPIYGGGFWVQENLFSFPRIETGFLGPPIRNLFKNMQHTWVLTYYSSPFI